MKLPLCSIAASDRSLPEAAELAAKYRLYGIEVREQPPHFHPDAGVAEARAAASCVRAAGVEIIAFGSYLGRSDHVARGRAERAVAIAEAMGTKFLRVWAEPTAEDGDELAPAVELIRTAADAAFGAGITVVVERHLGSFADTPSRIERLLDVIDRPNVALSYQVLDFLPTSAIDEQPADTKRLIYLARYFHLKNFQANPDGDGPLLLAAGIEKGALDYRAILKAAVKGGYRGPLTMEFLAADGTSVEEKLKADGAFVRTVLSELWLAD